MAGKGVALFVVCILFFAAVQVPQASAYQDADFAGCFKACDELCKEEGMGATFCEMKCDTDCFNREFNARIRKARHNL